MTSLRLLLSDERGIAALLVCAGVLLPLLAATGLRLRRVWSWR